MYNLILLAHTIKICVLNPIWDVTNVSVEDDTEYKVSRTVQKVAKAAAKAKTS